MARQKSFIKIIGNIGGLSFYESNGNAYIREAGGIKKERILTDPAFKRTRENMSEFGGAATVGKSLRMGLMSVSKLFAGRNIVGRLTQIMKHINQKSGGVRGKRSFDIVTNKTDLIGFEFNETNKFDSLFLAPYSIVANADKTQVTVTIPTFDTTNYVNAPRGATHFRLLCVLSVLSNFVYNDKVGAYEAVNPNVNKMNNLLNSYEIPIGGTTTGDLLLQCSLPKGAKLDSTSALIVCMGIEFLQQTGGIYYSLKSDSALKIRDVF